MHNSLLFRSMAFVVVVVFCFPNESRCVRSVAFCFTSSALRPRVWVTDLMMLNRSDIEDDTHDVLVTADTAEEVDEMEMTLPFDGEARDDLLVATIFSLRLSAAAMVPP
uniref:Putative secreted protein n=1 Tax=Anopheles darlingi TaxID=43151 RepID=A0A2M4D5T7_ANODA